MASLKEKLNTLRLNFVWAWINSDMRSLFHDIDHFLGRSNGRGFLHHAPTTSDIERIAGNDDLNLRIDESFDLFETYINEEGWFPGRYPGAGGEIAYFCTEFGIEASLPIYSGGLGVLAGDHLKEASDLGLPLVAVGLYYPEGYFSQRINEFGEQVADYPYHASSTMAMELVRDENGSPRLVSVEVSGRKIYAGIHRVRVGSVSLYLLDADVPENDEIDRKLTARLYCADRTRRLEQEVLLGVGGWRALNLLGHDVKFLHLNEGHSVFAALEWIRSIMVAKGINFDEARKTLSRRIHFTTHTPIPAGNETFENRLIQTHMQNMMKDLNLKEAEFLALGSRGEQEPDSFCLSAVALKVSGSANGVSRLHGMVSRRMWHCLYPNVHVNDVPIGYVTNGVHYGTWLAPPLRHLYRTYLGSDIEFEMDNPEKWRMYRIPDEELWQMHLKLKGGLVEEIRQRRRSWLLREGAPRGTIEAVASFLDPSVLTIGFARRFTGYKRAMLIFTDLKRLKNILDSSKHPVQIVMAGKSHPADPIGREFIKQISAIGNSKDFRGRVTFIEGYDMNLGRLLVSGVDVWLNNPTKPLEASGTSGQKAAINGVLNLSVLDGWWEEGYAGENGWGIEEDIKDSEEDVANRIYALLETQVAPLYYDHREAGCPVAWVARMKRAIASVAPYFNARRMLKEYCEKYYAPAMHV